MLVLGTAGGQRVGCPVVTRGMKMSSTIWRRTWSGTGLSVIIVREEAELGLDGVKRIRSPVGQRGVLIEDSGHHRCAFEPFVEMI